MFGCKGDEGLREVVQRTQNVCIAVQQKDHHLKPPIVSTLIQNLTKIHFLWLEFFGSTGYFQLSLGTDQKR